MRNQVLSLHSALNALNPGAVNSLVFLVLSRFVALLSSLLSALGAGGFDAGDPAMKEEFYRLEEELKGHPKTAR
jgi:hypothetical protein